MARDYTQPHAAVRTARCIFFRSATLLVSAAGGIFISGECAAFALVGYGLITLAVAIFVGNAVANAPVTFDSRRYAPNAMSVPIVVLALAVWAFWTALAGQRLIKSDALH